MNQRYIRMIHWTRMVLRSLFILPLLFVSHTVRAEQVDIIEFFNPLLGHYFMASDTPVPAGQQNEVDQLDSGGGGGNWVRTGQSWKAWRWPEDGAPDTAFPVCRFYSHARNSHFYTASPTECESVKATDPGWAYEGIAFYVERPTNQQCAPGLVPVMRSYNNRFAENDSNHRYATLPAIREEMRSLGWIPEGPSPAMCTTGALTNGGISPQQVSATVRTDTSETLQTSDGARVSIPMGAVAPTPSGMPGSATVTMAVDTTTRISLPEGESLASKVYRLTPSGHVFQSLVTVTLPLSVDPQGQEVRIYTQREDGTIESLHGYYDADTNTVTSQTLHFSPFWATFGSPSRGESCLQVDNTFASPYNGKNFCVDVVNRLDDPADVVNPNDGGSVSGPHDVVYGFAKVGWGLPPGNYDICVESWNRDTQLSLPSFRGSFVYQGVDVARRTMGSAGSWGDGCVTSLGVGMLGTPTSQNPCNCGAIASTPGGTGAALEVSLNWRAEPGVDLDLHVTDPSGEKVYYNHLASASGGSLDWDNQCSNYQNGRTENISWLSPPSGTYLIEVDYYGTCSSGAASPVQFQVNVKFGGTTKSYSGSVADGETVTVTELAAAGIPPVEYTGIATYDLQPAALSLVFNGNAVTGSLSKTGVCKSNIRLTQTNLALTGTLTGTWGRGQAGSISGTWTGGDSVCGTQLTAENGYPQAGTFEITRDGTVIRLVRTGPTPILPSGWSYDFND